MKISSVCKLAVPYRKEKNAAPSMSCTFLPTKRHLKILFIYLRQKERESMHKRGREG